MSLCAGIVGLPNVGKSTLFQTITKKQVDCSNYPFCTIDPNVGVVAVPDQRVDKLAELTKASKKIYTTIEFIDIAGLVKGASQGEGLGNKFLAQIKEVDLVIYVLRAFQSEKVINTQLKVDILKEKEILDMEMALKDLAALEKRIEGLNKEIKAGEKEAIKELAVLNKARGFLQKGIILFEQTWEDEERKILNSYQFLTLKPRLYLLNGNEEEVPAETKEIFKKNNWPFLIMDVLTELEAAELEPEERTALGLPLELKLENLIKETYNLLDLITFFSTKSDEIRAWTLRRGNAAPQAGAVIHNDFERYFIKAEVINWQELVKAGGFNQAREKGLIRTEGKSYIVQDGDIIEIKSGV